MITCVIPVFNETPERIKRSVVSALETNFPMVIIVDDGSDIPVIYPHNRVRVIRFTANLGPSDAMNAGIDASRDDYIARLDCGDVFYPDEKQQQIKWSMERGHPATFSHCVDEATGDVRKISDQWQSAIFTQNAFQASTIVFDRRVCGRYDEAIRWCSDHEFQARVQATVGWRKFDLITGTATAWPGGHTDVSGAKYDAARQSKDRATVSKRNKAHRLVAKKVGRA